MECRGQDGWGSGEFSLPFDERFGKSEDANLEGGDGGEGMIWAKALRWVYAWCVGGKAERLVQLQQREPEKEQKSEIWGDQVRTNRRKPLEALNWK